MVVSEQSAEELTSRWHDCSLHLDTFRVDGGTASFVVEEPFGDQRRVLGVTGLGICERAIAPNLVIVTGVERHRTSVTSGETELFIDECSFAQSCLRIIGTQGFLEFAGSKLRMKFEIGAIKGARRALQTGFFEMEWPTRDRHHFAESSNVTCGQKTKVSS